MNSPRRFYSQDSLPGAAPDVLLLGTRWPERALLRAQLIEEGHTVVAVEEWRSAVAYRRPGMMPRVIVIDLRGWPDPRATLNELRLLFPQVRVLVITALGTLGDEEVRRLGFAAIQRPAAIGDIVKAVATLLQA